MISSTYRAVVKTTVFLADMNDYPDVNKAYAECKSLHAHAPFHHPISYVFSLSACSPAVFPVDPPARSAVQVARLPKDAKVEIEAIALAKDTSANL